MDDIDRIGADLYRRRIAREHADDTAARDAEIAAELRAIADALAAYADSWLSSGERFAEVHGFASSLRSIAARLAPES